jgi:hypothetical protein
MLSSRAYAEPNSPSFLPSAPVAVKSSVFEAVNWSLAGSVVAARALDWTFTESAYTVRGVARLSCRPRW